MFALVQIRIQLLVHCIDANKISHHSHADEKESVYLIAQNARISKEVPSFCIKNSATPRLKCVTCSEFKQAKMDVFSIYI